MAARRVLYGWLSLFHVDQYLISQAFDKTHNEDHKVRWWETSKGEWSSCSGSCLLSTSKDTSDGSGKTASSPGGLEAPVTRTRPLLALSSSQDRERWFFVSNKEK